MENPTSSEKLQDIWNISHWSKKSTSAYATSTILLRPFIYDGLSFRPYLLLPPVIGGM